MRLTAMILTLAFLSGVAAEAQSLAEVARSERLRRAALTIQGRVYTNEDVRAFESTPSSPASSPSSLEEEQGAAGRETPEENADSADPAAAGLQAPGESELTQWQSQVTAQAALIRSLEDSEVRQQLEINRLRGLFLAPVTTIEARNRAQMQLATAENGLVSIREQLERARNELRRLESSRPADPSAEGR